jgi:SNF2 family DNA or RNA helicase
VQALLLYDVVLTSYGTLLSDISYLRRYQFGYVFLDESQQIKNIGSQRYHAARLLKSRNRLAITGTPIENNTLDLYAQFRSFVPDCWATSNISRMCILHRLTSLKTAAVPGTAAKSGTLYFTTHQGSRGAGTAR